ncbi:MAG: hypothetical protein IPM46_10545 [Flavobacteriales bacterium]|nr:hypothetical protein [Flavobacteriales bacterium]
MTSAAQWDLPAPLVLNGLEPQDRQVLGLANPIALDAAMSADAVRNQAVSYSTASGSVWQVSLQPGPAGYIPGMIITVVPDMPSEPGQQLDVNGLGSRDLVKADGTALDTAEVRAAVPTRLIYDGSRFLVLGTTYRPCPTGYQPGGRSFCIEDSTILAVNFFDAVNACTARNARLCSYNEWIQACTRLDGFLGSVLGSEWVDDAANSASDAKVVGYGGDGLNGTVVAIGCDRGTTTAPTNLRAYRCCRHR